MSFTPFLVIAAFVAIWILLGMLEERRAGTGLQVWVAALRGGVLATVFAILVALAVAEMMRGWMSDESRWVFMSLALGLSMIAFPIGLLVAVARARRGPSA